MKTVLFFTFLFFTIVASAQRRFALVASTNFDFAVTGFGTNNAGIGFTLSPGFVVAPRLHVKAEASLDHFVGSKLAYIDGAGNILGDNPTVLSGKVGPEIFLSSKVSIAGLYGFASIDEFNQKTTAGALKAELTTYVGRRKKGVLAFTYSAIIGPNSAVHFLGLHAGYKIF